MSKRRKISTIMGLSVAVVAGLSLVSCGGDTSDDSTSQTQKYSISYNVNGHGSQPTKTSDVSSIPSSMPTLTADGYTFGGWFYDKECILPANPGDALSTNVVLYAKWTANGSSTEQGYSVTYNNNGHGSAPAALSNVTALPATLPTLTDNDYTFDGWYTDSALTVKAVAGASISANTTLYAKWTAKSATPGVEYETVNYNINAEDFEVEKNAPLVSGAYACTSDILVRSRKKTWTNPANANETRTFTQSLKLDSSDDEITVTVQGTGTLYVYAQNGSSTAATRDLVVENNGTKTNYTIAGTEAYGDYLGGSPCVRVEIPVTKGTYVLTRDSGTLDIFACEMQCLVEKSEPTGIEIVDTSAIYNLEGEDFDPSQVQLNLVYANGRKDALNMSDVTCDYAESYDKTKAGEYTVSFTYQNYTAVSIKAFVCAIESIELGFTQIQIGSNSSAGNKQYLNKNVQQIYTLNESFDMEYLTVTAKTKATDGTEVEFILDNDKYVTTNASTAFDSSQAGTYEIEVTATANGNSKTVGYNVSVVDATPVVDTNGYVQVSVNPSYTGVIGAAVDGKNQFTTIQQALEYLGASQIESTTIKVITLAAGTYNEKLDITLPNVTIVGASAATTKIEYNALYGQKDASGFTHETDSTATLSIRDTAYNCNIQNVTISNYWNNYGVFDKAFGTNYGEHRALALLVQSDQFKMKGCRLLGYQDTLELFTGRQLIEDTYIAGTTDFIFGTNNTTYFKNCQIHSIDTGKVGSNGELNTINDGGYITAFKGTNNGKAVQYGAIFDGCDFTADAVTLASKRTAIARPWDSYSAVMVMNSTLAAHISTTGYTAGSTKNQRYVGGLTGTPLDSTIKFFEYNNTGDGKITESVSGCTVLTDATEAAKYADYATIFAAENGGVTYTAAWDPTSNVVVIDPNKYYFFNGGSSPTGTSYTYSSAIQSTTSTWNGLTIDASTGKLSYREANSDTQFNATTKISFEVEAGSTVTVEAKSANYTLNGVGTTSKTTTRYYATAQTVTLEATGSTYLLSLTIKPNQEAPEAATLSSIAVSGNPTDDLELNTELDLSKLVVKATYSDGSIVTLASTDYTVNATAVDSANVGSYTVTVSYQDKTAQFIVKYVAEVSNVISSNLTYSFKGDTAKAAEDYIVFTNDTLSAEGTTAAASKLNVDATKGKFSYNGSGWYQFNLNTVLSFEVGAACILDINRYDAGTTFTVALDGVEVAANANGTYTITGAGRVTITAGSNGHLGYIAIEF